MKYISEKMIKKSRFINFINALDKNSYDKTVEIMTRLLEENKEYADKKTTDIFVIS